jgi:hypothetical protein
MMAEKRSPDDVCLQYARRKTNVSVRMLDRRTILIEAPATGLKFLGDLLLAQADFKKDCGFSLGPAAAGSVFFDQTSKKGIHIHRLPCLNDKPKKQRPAQKEKLAIGRGRRKASSPRPRRGRGVGGEGAGAR